MREDWRNSVLFTLSRPVNVNKASGKKQSRCRILNPRSGWGKTHLGKWRSLPSRGQSHRPEGITAELSDPYVLSRDFGLICLLYFMDYWAVQRRQILWYPKGLWWGKTLWNLQQAIRGKPWVRSWSRGVQRMIHFWKTATRSWGQGVLDPGHKLSMWAEVWVLPRSDGPKEIHPQMGVAQVSCRGRYARLSCQSPLLHQNLFLSSQGVGPLWPSDREVNGQIWFIEGLAQ